MKQKSKRNKNNPLSASAPLREIKHKILLACPVSRHKEYIFWQWLQHATKIMEATQKADVYIYLVDNSPDADFYKEIRRAGVHCDRIRFSGELREVMARCNELIRRRALKTRCDYLFSLECDIFPPLNIIHRLLTHRKQVAGAPYFIHKLRNRKPVGAMPMLQYPFFRAKGVADITNASPLQGFFASNGKLNRAFGIGLGCVLIHKSVLKTVPFRIIPDMPGHADTFFYFDLHHRNIPVWIDTSLTGKLEHHNTTWRQVEQNEMNYANIKKQVV